MLPIPIDTQWLINRESYGPEVARKMREDAWPQSWGVSGGGSLPAERNSWLIETGNGPSLFEAISAALARFRRIGRPLPTAQQP